MNERLHNILQEIKSGTRKYVEDLVLTEEDLLAKDNNGITFLEHLIKHKFILNNMHDVINNNVEIAYIICKEAKYLYYHFDENTLFSNFNGKRIIDYILEKKDITEGMVENIKNHIEIIDLLISTNNGFYLLNLSPEIIKKIITKDGNGIYLIEKYINDKIVLSYILPRDLKNIQVDKDFINFLLEKNLYEYLENVSEDVLLLEVYPSKTLLEVLIEKRYNPNFNYIVHDKKTIQVLYKCKKLDLIKRIDDSVLLTSAKEILNDNNIKEETFLEYTYLDYILECIKQGKIKQKVENLKPSKSYRNVAKFYIILAKHGMMGYINSLTVEELLCKKSGVMQVMQLLKPFNMGSNLEENRTLLEELLNIDSNLTINKILTENVKSNPQIALILKSKGFEQKNIDVSNEKIGNITRYIEGINNRLGVLRFSKEGEMLLMELTRLFISDGKSDIKLILALESGYRQSLLINYQVNIEELKRLIEVKKNNFDKFCYIKTGTRSYFDEITGLVYCNEAIVTTILHETGHALHFYLTHNMVPDDYKEIILRASQNPEILKKAKEYSDAFFKLNDKILELVKREYKGLSKKYYTEKKKREIESILAKSKEEKIKEYSNLGISKEQIDIILNEMYTVEEYIASQKRIFIREKTDAIMRNKCGALISIGDILDAIYDGKLKNGNLVANKGENIRVLYGHGISYYYNSTNGFCEMIANFASISKLSDSEGMLKLLKEIVGEEVYNMISNFYYENIVGLIHEEKYVKRIGGR